MKTTEEIYQQLMAAFTQRYGSEPEESCDLAVRLYAAAAELQALSIQADWVLAQSFPQTAEGVYLDRHAFMRGLHRTPAIKATGTLRFSVGSAASVALTIPEGTVCMSADETRFITTETVALPAGSLWVDAAAEAVEAGKSGNAATGTVTLMTACPVGITGCTNPSAFTGGCEEETDASLRKRLLESYQRLPNGANAAFYEQTAMAHSDVVAAQAVGRARGIGTVDVYVAVSGGLPEEALVQEIQADLARKREIAVDVQVLSPSAQTVDVAVELAVRDGADFAGVQAEVEKAVQAYFSGKLLGKAALLAELGSRIYAVDGVENYHLLQPETDTAPAPAVLPVLGTLQITEITEA